MVEAGVVVTVAVIVSAVLAISVVVEGAVMALIN